MTMVLAAQAVAAKAMYDINIPPDDKTLETVQIRKVPAVSTVNNNGFVIGWSSANQEEPNPIPNIMQYNVFGQMFDKDGMKTDNEFSIAIANGRQYMADLIQANNGFVALWLDQTEGIYACLFDKGGVPTSNVLLINARTTGNRFGAKGKSIGDNKFITVWHENTNPNNNIANHNIRARILQVDKDKLTAIASEIKVTDYTEKEGKRAVDPAVEVLGDNLIAITYHIGSIKDTPCGADTASDKASCKPYLQLFDFAGKPLLNEPYLIVDQLARENEAGKQATTTINRLKSGNMVATWQINNPDDTGRTLIRGQVLSYDEKSKQIKPIGNPFELSAKAVAGHYHEAAVIDLEGGGFAVGWEKGEKFDDTKVYMQLFDPFGEKIRDELLISDVKDLVHSKPVFAHLDDGKIVVAWNAGKPHYPDIRYNIIDIKLWLRPWLWQQLNEKIFFILGTLATGLATWAATKARDRFLNRQNLAPIAPAPPVPPAVQPPANPHPPTQGNMQQPLAAAAPANANNNNLDQTENIVKTKTIKQADNSNLNNNQTYKNNQEEAGMTDMIVQQLNGQLSPSQTDNGTPIMKRKSKPQYSTSMEATIESIQQTVSAPTMLQQLLQNSAIEKLTNQGKRVVFQAPHLANSFVEELFKIGIENRGMKGTRRKMEVLAADSNNNNSQERYAIDLTNDEWNALPSISPQPQLVTQLNEHFPIKSHPGLNASAESEGKKSHEGLSQSDNNALQPIFLKMVQAIKESKSSELARLLKQEPTAIEVSNSQRQNLLHIAVLEGQEASVKQLLEKYSYQLVNQEDNEGRTPLQLSIINDQLTIFKLFLRKEDKKSKTANSDNIDLLIKVAAHGAENILQWLLTSTNANYTVEVLAKLVQKAAEFGHLICIKLLVSSVTDPVAKKQLITKLNDEGLSPLYLASNNNHITVVKYLLEEGADPCVKDIKGIPLWHIVKERDQKEMIDTFKGYIINQAANIIAHTFKATIQFTKQDAKKEIYESLFLNQLKSNTIFIDFILTYAPLSHGELEQIGSTIGLNINNSFHIKIKGVRKRDGRVKEDFTRIKQGINSTFIVPKMNDYINSVIKSAIEQKNSVGTNNKRTISANEQTFRRRINSYLEAHFQFHNLIANHILGLLDQSNNNNNSQIMTSITQLLNPASTLVANQITNSATAVLAQRCLDSLSTSTSLLYDYAIQYFKKMSDRELEEKAKNVIDAFKSPDGLQSFNGKQIHSRDIIKTNEVIDKLVERYREQIEKLPLGGVTLLAECIVERIVAHIANGRDEREGESTIKAVRVIQRIKDSAQRNFATNYNPQEFLPLWDRIILALKDNRYGRNKGSNVEIEGKPIDIFKFIEHTGLKIKQDNGSTKYYYHKMFKDNIEEQEKYGYCVGEKGEENDEKFIERIGYNPYF